MNKLIDEYDLELQPDRLVAYIDLYGVTEDEWGYILRCDDSPDFFSVYRIEEKQAGYLLPVCVGDFSDIEDAKSYANRLCEKYNVRMVNDCLWHTKLPTRLNPSPDDATTNSNPQ